jgi:hypothetical protein
MFLLTPQSLNDLSYWGLLVPNDERVSDRIFAHLRSLEALAGHRLHNVRKSLIFVHIQLYNDIFMRSPLIPVFKFSLGHLDQPSINWSCEAVRIPRVVSKAYKYFP